MKRIIILMMNGTIYTKNLTEEDHYLLSGSIKPFLEKYNIDRDNVIRIHYTNYSPSIIEL